MSLTKKVAFLTLGCKVNQYETESIKKQFLDKAYEEEEFDKKADVYIINSCTVTSIADRKTRNFLRRAKKINPKAIVVATGCYAQTNAEDIAKIKEVDLIVGNNKKNFILNLVESELNRKTEVENIMEDLVYEEMEFSTLREMSRAYVKIQDGCNNFCSYCKIPFARGPKRSRNLKSIIKEIELLSKEGYKEIILIGINLGAYGEDLKEEIGLEDVLEKAAQIDGIERIRIGSIYPDKISERLLDLLKNNNKIMPHLHISLQSGSDKILKLMNRKYNREEAMKILKRLQNEVDEISLTADIIVGFPGEGEEEFKETYDFIDEISFSDIHIFQYSEREKTKAIEFKEKVLNKDKKERMEKLEELRKKLSILFRSFFIGKNIEILVEESLDGITRGYSKNYLKVELRNRIFLINHLENVKVSGIEKELLLSD